MTITEKKIHEIDAAGVPFGRLATKIATLLIGKGKASYLPHLDNGDEVVVSNVALIKVTGQKMDQKLYRHHTMYPGHLREKQMKDVMAEDPKQVIIHAVMGMLPKNKHRAIYIKRLTFK
ncbi:MAG: 50S ribosomal protein L13 [bacterium]